MDDVSSRLRERSQSHLDAAARDFDAPLAGRGFMRRPFERDHVPAGHEGPPERWAKRLWVRRDASEAAVNLHVRVRGSPNERLALLFRDWFRAHPLAVPAYGQFKIALGDAVRDIEPYTEIKDHVVDLVIVPAEEWALETGWRP